MKELAAVVLIIAIVLGAIGGAMWGWPNYRVWQQQLEGQASFNRAEIEKKIMIETARSKSEAAKLEGIAEVERAKGMAEAIKIVGEESQKYPEYKAQRFIEAFATSLEGDNPPKLIFVPTEANIPLLPLVQPSN